MRSAASGSSARAIAHPNIALSKYWGKLAGQGNFPAVPSLSVTLAGLATTTAVTFDRAFAADEVVLNGAVVAGTPLARVSALLDQVREAAGVTTRAQVVSTNDFPTASGLASSASGFAALAVAATAALRLDWDAARIADLARRSSASAARSVFGGFVELGGGATAPVGARVVCGPDAFDLVVIVCVTSEGEKPVKSTDGMRRTAEASPYYPAWLDHAPRLHGELLAALLARDFSRVGELAEASALAMHALALSAGIAYVSGATLSALAEVRALRDDGVPAYATIDAGPHLKCLVQARDVERARARLERLPGILRTIVARPGDGARQLVEAT